MAIIPICDKHHRKIVAGICPWCKRSIWKGEVTDEEPVQPSVGIQPDRQALVEVILSRLIQKLDLSRVTDLGGETVRREIMLVVGRLCDTECPLLSTPDREAIIDAVMARVLE